MKAKYLLDDTHEVREMLLKIQGMLASGEEANIELAFQILAGGGIAPSLLPQLLGLALLHPNQNIRKKAIKYFRKIASAELYQQANKHFNRYDYYYLREAEVYTMLSQLTGSTELDKSQFANFVLKLTHKGGKFCLEHHTAPVPEILHRLMDGDYISFADFELTTLPSEIGQLSNLHTLDLSNNPLQAVPDELVHLKHLKYIYFNPEKLSPQATEKLERFFPHIIAQRYAENAWSLVNQQEMQNALNLMEKALKLNPEDAAIWDGKAWILSSLQQYPESVLCIDQAIQNANSPVERALYWVNKGSTCQRMRQHPEAQSAAYRALDLLKAVPKFEWSVEHYFSHGLGMFLLNDYENAHKSYDQAIRFNAYYGGGVCWYNKACVYAKQGEKNEMLKALERAMDIGWQFWHKEAAIDCDFEDFWQDAEFRQLLNN
ncbi:MAG: tetratricopeptide repeat protein [Microscillaceae bacterium]|jgi:tetratricopeptide (TPR) repeat protein|nr:tetratricopeptide repeat protein [Microscillaceae bacterium]